MDTTIVKLILLYVLDQMEIPVTSETLNEMCCSQNNWLSYMTLTEVLPELVDARFVSACTNAGTDYYKITQEGRDCLNYFFMKIPSSIRKDIGSYIKKNRQTYKRKQEYFRDYYKNRDGTYTVNLKIIDPTCSKLELKLNVANRAEAITVFKKWNESASDVYSAIYKILIEGE
jgi:predicted transcriptional regulator